MGGQSPQSASQVSQVSLVPHTLSSPVYGTLGEVAEWVEEKPVPVHLVWGMKDPILGKSIYATRKLFPDAVVTETDAGHFLQEEVPDVIADAILEIVASG